MRQASSSWEPDAAETGCARQAAGEGRARVPSAGKGEASSEKSTDAEGDERTYTVTGLDDDTAYRITLVPGDNITFTEGDDEATFVEAVGEDEEPNGLADSAGAESVATIVEVNGEAVTEEEQGRTVPAGDDDPSDPSGIFPVDGVITFTIDGVDSAILPTPNPGGTIRPVVNVNGGESTFLEIDEDEGEEDP